MQTYAKCDGHKNHHLFCRMMVPRNLAGKYIKGEKVIILIKLSLNLLDFSL